MSDHEKRYLEGVAADPAIDDFTPEDLTDIQSKPPVDWYCIVKCYIEYRICRANGGSQTQCRAELAKCLLGCRKP